MKLHAFEEAARRRMVTVGPRFQAHQMMDRDHRIALIAHHLKDEALIAWPAFW